MLKQLQREHLQLQRSFSWFYQMIIPDVGPAQAIKLTKWLTERQKLEEIIQNMRNQIKQLQNDLVESRERVELLEFCFLELQNERKVSHHVVDRGMNTEQDAQVIQTNEVPRGMQDSTLLTDEQRQSLVKTIQLLQRCNSAICGLENTTTKMEDKIKEDQADVKEEYGECKTQLQEAKKDLIILSDQLSSPGGGHQGISNLLDLLGDVQNILTSAKEGKNVQEEILNEKTLQLNNLQEEIKESARVSQDPLPRFFPEDESPVSQNFKVEYHFQGQEVSVHQQNGNNGSTLESDSRAENSKQELEAKNLKLYFSYKKENTKQVDGLVTSEDEGLGDESHRLHSTSPRSINSPSDDDISPSSSLIKYHEPHKCQGGDYNKAFYEEINKAKTQYSAKLIELQRKEKEFEEQMIASQSFISKLQSSILLKEEQVDNLIKENFDLAQGKLQQNNEMESMKLTLIGEIKELKKKLSGTNNEKSHFKNQISELEAAEKEARIQGEILQERLQVIQDKGFQFQRELEEAKRKLETCSSDLKGKTEKEKNLKSHLEVLVETYKNQIANLELSQNNLQERLHKMEEHMECCKSKVNPNFVDSYTPNTVTTTETKTGVYCKIPKEKCKNQIHNLESSPVNLPKHQHQAESYAEHCQSNDGIHTENPNDELSTFLIDNCKNIIDKLESSQVNLETHPYVPGDYMGNCKLNASTSAIEHINFEPHKMLSQIDVPEQSNSTLNNHSSILNTSSDNIQSRLRILPESQELINRFNIIENEDMNLQKQLHHMDEINSCLWRKLNYLETHTGQSKKDISCLQQCTKVSQKTQKEGTADKMVPLEKNEQQIKERLMKLDKINTEFEKDLEISENIFQEKQNQKNEWIKAESIIKTIMKGIEAEKLSLEKKVEELETQKNDLQRELNKLESELVSAKTKHQKQLDELSQKHNELVLELQGRINDLNAKGKEYLIKIEKLESRSLERAEQKYLSLSQEIEEMRGILFDLKKQIKREEEEMLIMKKDFKMNFNSLKEYQLTEEKKLRNQIDTMASKETEYNNNILYLLQEHKNLETKLNSKEQELKKMQEKFETKIKLLEEEHQMIEEELTRKLYEIEERASTKTKALEAEKLQLESELQTNVEELQNKELLYKFRISELEDHIKLLHNDVENITCDLKNNHEKDLQFGNYYIMENLQELQQKEKILKEKIEELEQNETAYKETLDHADQIVASLERGYKNKIHELELSEECLREQVLHLEETTTALRKSLQQERRSLEGKKSSEKELAEAEARELALKEKLDELRYTQREMVQRAKEMEKEQKHLETRLHDHDRLLHAMEKLQKDHETQQKELKKLQKSEAALQVSLQEADVMLGEREREMKQETEIMKDENHQLEETIWQLRSQVKELQQQINTERLDMYASEESILKALSTREMAIQTELSTPSEEEMAPDECTMESKLHLEECMIRAMVALQLELQKKALTEEKSFDENESTDSSMEFPTSTEFPTMPAEEVKIADEAPLAELEKELLSDYNHQESFEQEEFKQDNDDESEILV